MSDQTSKRIQIIECDWDGQHSSEKTIGFTDALSLRAAAETYVCGLGHPLMSLGSSSTPERYYVSHPDGRLFHGLAFIFASEERQESGQESAESAPEETEEAKRFRMASDAAPSYTFDWERQESAERIPPYNGETDKHYRRAGDLRGFCACGERFTEEHLASLTDGWHDTDDQGNPVCWCGESAEYINGATDASPEHPCCEKHVKDGLYRAIEEPTRVGTFNPLIPDDVIDWDQESQESAPELVNGCNLEACLTYARERIAALESERDEERGASDYLRTIIEHARERIAGLEGQVRDLRAKVNRERERADEAEAIIKCVQLAVLDGDMDTIRTAVFFEDHS
jgi:hypothetical protein